MAKSRKKAVSIKPKRGYQWLCPLWIGSISAFIAIRILIDGQCTFGEPDGKIITALSTPIMFWTGVAFPGAVCVWMIILIVRGEQDYRAFLHSYQTEMQNDNDESISSN